MLTFRACVYTIRVRCVFCFRIKHIDVRAFLPVPVPHGLHVQLKRQQNVRVTRFSINEFLTRPENNSSTLDVRLSRKRLILYRWIIYLCFAVIQCVSFNGRFATMDSSGTVFQQRIRSKTVSKGQSNEKQFRRTRSK